MTALEMQELFHDLPTLTTKRLRLRRLTLDDAADIFEYARDPEVSRYTMWHPHSSREDSLAFLAKVVGLYGEGQAATWGMVLRAGD